MSDWPKKLRISNNAIIDGQDLWLVSNYTNVLMNYDIKEGDLKQIYYFPEKFVNTYSTISYVKIENKIYFAPYNGKNLWCFYILTKKFENIDLRLDEKEKDVKQKFRVIISYKRKLILIGFGIHSIFCVNIDSNTVKRCDKYLIELEKRGIKAEETFLGFGYQLVGDVLYLSMLNHNIIIAFYLEDESFQIYDNFDLNSSGFDSIEYNNGKFRIITCDSEEVIWDCEGGQESKTKLSLTKNHKRNYWKTFQYNETFIYFPLFDTRVYARHKKENIEVLSFLYPESELFINGSKYEFVKRNNEKIYFQARTNGDCFCIDLEQMLIRLVKLKSPDNGICRQILKNVFSAIDDEKLYESEIVNISNYLHFLDSYQKKENKTHKKVGELMYMSLK